MSIGSFGNSNYRGALILRSSFSLLRDRMGDVVHEFYGRLFLHSPDLRSLFPEDIRMQERKLASALELLVLNLEDEKRLASIIRGLADRHVHLGLKSSDYQLVRSILVEVIRDFLSNEEDSVKEWDSLLAFVCDNILLHG